MNHISMQIPSSIYVDMYEVFGEATEEKVIAALKSLAHEPRSPVVITYARPREGTITGKVWAIADQIEEQYGKAKREDVVQACVKQGINMNTASTQFSNWNRKNRDY